MKNIIKNTSLQFKLLMSHMLVIIFIIGFISYSLHYVASGIVRNSVIDANNTLVVQINTNINHMLRELQVIIDAYSFDPIIQEILRDPPTENALEKSKSHNIYRDFTVKHQSIFNRFSYSVLFYGYNGRHYSKNLDQLLKIDNITNELWYKEIQSTNGSIICIPGYYDTFFSSESDNYLLIGRVIKDFDKGKPLGVLVFYINEDVIGNTYSNSLEDNNLFLIDKKGFIISHSLNNL